MLWFILAALTGAALFCIIWPLRAARRAWARPSSEIAFLRGELAGLERDAAQGLASAEAAQSARAELGRRLIAASKGDAVSAHAAQPGAAFPARRKIAAALLVVLAPALAFGVYTRIGSPDYVAETAAPGPVEAGGPEDMLKLIAQVEAHLSAHPEDGRGFEVLGPVYLRLGRADDAARAYASALRLLGPSAERQANYGEALYAAASNIVTAEARAAFEAAEALDAKGPKARFYLGLAASQEGDGAKAKAIWSALVADSPADAPWLGAVKGRLAAFEGPQSNPQAARDIAAVAVPQQQAMIRQMVDGLAARLANDGNDLAGWQKLVRAYAVLAEPDKAKQALRAARDAFASDASASAALDGLARDLGLDG